MPSEFFKRSTIWVVDFRYDGRARRWYQSFGPGVDVQRTMQTRLRDLYGARAELAEVRPATWDEETLYLRGEAPGNSFCPTGLNGVGDGGRGGGGRA